MENEYCRNAAYSNDYYDFVLLGNELPIEVPEDDCLERVDAEYTIGHFPAEGLPATNYEQYAYSSVPKLLAPMAETATRVMEVSGILPVRNQPALGMTGAGVLIGIIDSGIDYTNPIFRYSDGSSRIVAMWDQTIMEGPAPERFYYGTEYLQSTINEALALDDPQAFVPTMDESGHGTALAALAAGGNGYDGAAPDSELVVVKLKQAKQYLREFYFVKDGATAYANTDVMTAVSYVEQIATLRNQPVVIVFGLGTNHGSHAGNSRLSAYLDTVAQRRSRAVVIATGNEANQRHHFYGSVTGPDSYQEVEIDVGNNVTGFQLELWSEEPELYEVAIVSPIGQRISRVAIDREGRNEFFFLLEGTTVTVDYRIVGKRSANQLIYIRFDKPSVGIWKLVVYPKNFINGHFDIWLPLSEFLTGEVVFLQSNPDTTLTVPSATRVPMTVGGYNSANDSIYMASGRGYTLSGAVKPDFVAPAVEILGPAGEELTGTSYAAAITGGAAALFMEWAIVRGNDVTANSVDVKNELIRGCVQTPGRLYPNREWGYGKLNLEQTFYRLAGFP